MPPPRYCKVKPIGKGSFGLVWLVEEAQSAQLRVLKEIKLRGLPEDELQATMNEVEVLRRLEHKNIVEYHQAFINDQGELCIMMEFCPGGDLARVIQGRKAERKCFSEKDVTAVMLGLVQALSYCHHDVRLLHRDLKPHNVFLKGEVIVGKIEPSQIKLGDFGISKMLGATQALAQTQCGTPLYMAPEMCRGESYDKRADVWALGCILYELMLLEAPHLRQFQKKGAAGGVEALLKHISTSRLDLDRARLRQQYSAELCGLLMALLAPLPDERPSLRSVQRWPLFEARAAMGVPEEAHQPKRQQKQAEVAAIPKSSHEHAAAQIARSFHRSKGKRPAGLIRKEDFPRANPQKREVPLLRPRFPRETPLLSPEKCVPQPPLRPRPLKLKMPEIQKQSEQRSLQTEKPLPQNKSPQTEQKSPQREQKSPIREQQPQTLWEQKSSPTKQQPPQKNPPQTEEKSPQREQMSPQREQQPPPQWEKPPPREQQPPSHREKPAPREQQPQQPKSEADAAASKISTSFRLRQAQRRAQAAATRCSALDGPLGDRYREAIRNYREAAQLYREAKAGRLRLNEAQAMLGIPNPGKFESPRPRAFDP